MSRWSDWYEDMGIVAIGVAGALALLWGITFLVYGAWVRGLMTLTVTGVAAWALLDLNKRR